MEITTNQKLIADKFIKAWGIAGAVNYAKETLRVQTINGNSSAVTNWKTIIEYMEAK